jgi:glyoxylase-like metal-dependent hydrolase (beta-lactamase superfamily II)
VPLEDELGDVLEKAMSCAGMTIEVLAEKSGVPESGIRDAIDYRPDLGPAECGRLAAALGLNEVGLCALASGKYPLPDAEGLPFPVWPLRMPYGIGVVNAYAVGLGDGSGLLFDTGPDAKAVQAAWPPGIRSLSAVFITHVETEHSGGIAGVRGRFGASAAFVPSGQEQVGARPMGEGETFTAGTLEVSAFRTPGHCAMHNCYHVRSLSVPSARSLLLTGDLIFAGSAGGPYHCKRQLRDHLRRVLAAVPRDTVVAPGHGPMTTAGNELCYNPFVA